VSYNFGVLVYNVFVLWLVALAGTKLVKETEPVENSAGIFRVNTDKQLVIHVVRQRNFLSNH